MLLRIVVVAVCTQSLVGSISEHNTTARAHRRLLNGEAITDTDGCLVLAARGIPAGGALKSDSW